MTTRLQVGVSRFPHLEPLFSDPAQFGSVLELELVEGGTVKPLREVLSKSVPDVFEMPIVNYLAAKELGFEATAIPVFTARRFIHRMLEVPLRSPIRDPKDFGGRRIASAYYGNTDAVWARGVLQEDYGVDLSEATWVTTDEERVPGSRTPSELRRVDQNIDDMLLRGDADAKITGGFEPLATAGNRFLWEDPDQAAAAWFATTGIFPPLQVLVVKNSALETSGHLAKDLFSIFSESKALALAEIRDGHQLEERQRAGAFRSPYLGEDPLHYGLRANAEALERLLRYALRQEAIRSDHDLGELFADVE